MTPILVLSYPPSANRLWRYVGGRAIKSEAYRAWLKVVGVEIMIARCGRVTGPYRLEIRASPPDRRRRDIDNLLKPISDALVTAGVVADDCAAISVYVEWAPDVVKGGRIVATVRAA